jgi:rsbT co-antagonist protein RsbR
MTIRSKISHRGAIEMNETDHSNVPKKTRDSLSVQRMLDVSPLAMFVLGIDSRLIAHGRRLATILGMTTERLDEQREAALRERIHPHDRPLITSHLERMKAARDDEVISIELRMIDSDGELRFLLNRCVVLSRDENGEVQEILVTAQDVTDDKRRDGLLSREQTLFRAFREYMPALLYAKDPEGTYLLTNRTMDEFLGIPTGTMLGKKDLDFFPPELAAKFNEADDRVRKVNAPIESEEVTPHRDGSIKTFYSIKFPVEGVGVPKGSIAGISVDITPIKMAEAEREMATQALISAQRHTIHELATPLMPIADGVLAVPLIGLIDSERAGHIIETLLAGVYQYQASVVIIDITGVKVVDAKVAEALLQVARAVGLLGAKAVLTGIQSGIARTLIGLGIDLTGLVTEANLQRGIAHALRLRKRSA